MLFASFCVCTQIYIQFPWHVKVLFYYFLWSTIKNKILFVRSFSADEMAFLYVISWLCVINDSAFYLLVYTYFQACLSLETLLLLLLLLNVTELNIIIIELLFYNSNHPAVNYYHNTTSTLKVKENISNLHFTYSSACIQNKVTLPFPWR